MVRDWARRTEDPVMQDRAKEMINAKMGWLEAARVADMQQHYEESQIRLRIEAGLMTADM